MRELRLRVAADAVEEALDGLLPALPGGLHVCPDGDQVELRIAEAPGAPGEGVLRDLVGPGLIALNAAEVSDDWRQRRLERYRPLVIAERLLVRPHWAAATEEAGVIEIVLGEGNAFGTGVHPTTQACLAVLAEADPGGSLADYGCGTGVLAIAAARLGWAPVIAIDVDDQSAAVARRNAAANGVEIDVRVGDLVAAATPPAATTIVANLPPAVQASAAARLGERPSLLVASGFWPDEAPLVAAAWEAHDLEVIDQVHAGEWAVLLMR